MVKEEKQPREEKDVKFDFTLNEYKYFCEQCMFSDVQKEILERKIRGDSNVKIAMELPMSPATLDRNIRKIKRKIFRVL